MSDLVVKNQGAIVDRKYTPEEISLIKATVAKGATDDEFKLFLYRAQVLELDPLKPGQIYFIKYGTSPGTIVIGIDGFRAKAQRSGKFAGIQRGVLSDDKGRVIGAWCEVYRSDWKAPAREEISLLEYSTSKGMWAKMPGQMAKKVAEAAALRMAFPDDLGGVYSEEEMDQAEIRDVRTSNASKSQAQLDAPAEIEVDPLDEALGVDPAKYVFELTPLKGKAIGDVSPKSLNNFVDWYNGEAAKSQSFKAHPKVEEAYNKVVEFLSGQAK